MYHASPPIICGVYSLNFLEGSHVGVIVLLLYLRCVSASPAARLRTLSRSAWCLSIKASRL